MKETEQIKVRYERRKTGASKHSSIYSDYIVKERNLIYSKIINDHFINKDIIRILEIGAGSGGNIEFFKSIGIRPNHIFANELLEDRLISLNQNHPDINVLPGNALEISNELQFDLVFQSTVFTSILDKDFRKQLSDKIWDMTKPGGIILWYDFIFDNPKNPDVKKVSVKELKSLFPKGEFVFEKKVTLAPPIGRKVGKWYSFFNLFPFLRSHYIAVIQKK